MAVDGVTEARLLALEKDKATYVMSSSQEDLGSMSEPVFKNISTTGARPKTRRVVQVASDVELIELDSDSKTKKKKRQERKSVHVVKTMSQEYASKLSQNVDRTVIEKRAKRAETMTLADAVLLSKTDVEELSEITVGNIAQATQPWSVEAQVTTVGPKQVEEQKDLMDFLKKDNLPLASHGQWQDNVNIQAQQLPEGPKVGPQEAWKQDPRIQALIVDRMQQIEAEAKQETIQGKRKRSGRFNTTDSSNAVSYRRYANENILVGTTKRRVTFDELTPIQFALGFVKNVNDTIDPLTRRFMMAELYEILKLIEATSWSVAKGAYIVVMHAIEDGELMWQDRLALMQYRMTHTHAAAFVVPQARPATTKVTPAQERRLICKFPRVGTCRELGDCHTDPLMGLIYHHDASFRKK